MVDPDREPLTGLVEVDETSLPFRAKDGPVRAKPGRSHEGRLLVAGAVEIRGKAPGRARLAAIGDYSANTLGGFVACNLAQGSTVVRGSFQNSRARRPATRKRQAAWSSDCTMKPRRS